MISRDLYKYFKINYIFNLLTINTLKIIELWSFQLLIRIIYYCQLSPVYSLRSLLKR